jgi:hypothetical protein
MLWESTVVVLPPYVPVSADWVPPTGGVDCQAPDSNCLLPTQMEGMAQGPAHVGLAATGNNGSEDLGLARDVLAPASARMGPRHLLADADGPTCTECWEWQAA